MLFGLVIFYVVNPIFTPGVLFILAAIILEAASVALSPKEDQGLCPSIMFFEAAPVRLPRTIELIRRSARHFAGLWLSPSRAHHCYSSLSVKQPSSRMAS